MPQWSSIETLGERVYIVRVLTEIVHPEQLVVFQGKPDCHGCAFLFRALDLKLSAKLSDNGSTNGQPETITIGLGRKERLLRLGKMVARHATARVLHCEFEPVQLSVDSDFNEIACISGIPRVTDEVEE